MDVGPQDFCDQIQQECADLFCSPMCRNNTWDCDVTFDGDFATEKTAGSKEALCGEFLAYGCAQVLDCCPDDARLFDFVENQVFQDDYPNPKLPIKSCFYDPKANPDPEPGLCQKCKDNVHVTVTTKVCPYPAVTPPPALLLINEHTTRLPMEDEETINQLLDKIQQDQIALNRAHQLWMQKQNVETVPHWESLLQVQDRNSIIPIWPMDWPGEAAFKSLKERCDKLLTKVTGVESKLQTSLSSSLCICAGCCKGDCYYPVTEYMGDPTQ